VFDRFHLAVLDRLGEQGRLDWSRASVGFIHAAVDDHSRLADAEIQAPPVAGHRHEPRRSLVSVAVVRLGSVTDDGTIRMPGSHVQPSSARYTQKERNGVYEG
jgi:hypothetical protein